MPQCFVTTCGNYYGKTRGNSKIIYHMFPSSEDLALKWSEVCRGEKIRPPAYSRVCSDHFSPSCYQRDLQHELLGLPLRRRLRPDALPDRNIPRTKNVVPMRSSLRIAKRESIELVRKKENHGDDVQVKNIGYDSSKFKQGSKEIVRERENHGRVVQIKLLGEDIYKSMRMIKKQPVDVVSDKNTHGYNVHVQALEGDGYKNSCAQYFCKSNFQNGVDCKSYGDGVHRNIFFRKNDREEVVCKDNVYNSMGKVEFLAGLRLKCKNKEEICESVKVPIRECECANAECICR